MTWNPAARRTRRERLPRLEPLETRQLLSLAPSLAPEPSTPRPASSATAGAENASFDALIGASAARAQYGEDGSGLAAAVIDTGVDYTHPALGGAFGPGHKVEGGLDLAMGDPDPRAETWSHGTMVSGLIASGASDASGVAPGADVVALRVFGNDNQGSFGLIADALQWVVDHHAEENISVVNISLSDGGNYTSNPFLFSQVGGRIRGLIGQLRDLNIPVVAAAGNSFDGQAQGMGYVAILDKTISVTASDASDHLVGNAQRLGGASGTDLAAPGSGLLTTSESGGFTRAEGTSFAAPLVSGAILLLQGIYESRFGRLPTVDMIEGWLKAGAKTITDPATGIAIGRLDVAKSASLIPGAPTPPPTTPEPPPSDPVDNPAPTPDPVEAPAPNPTPPTPEPPAKPDPVDEPPPAPSTPPAEEPAPPQDSGPSPGQPDAPASDGPSETPSIPADAMGPVGPTTDKPSAVDAPSPAPPSAPASDQGGGTTSAVDNRLDSTGASLVRFDPSVRGGTGTDRDVRPVEPPVEDRPILTTVVRLGEYRQQMASIMVVAKESVGASPTRASLASAFVERRKLLRVARTALRG
jgi:type VI secretion system secreted protein VgrG